MSPNPKGPSYIANCPSYSTFFPKTSLTDHSTSTSLSYQTYSTNSYHYLISNFTSTLCIPKLAMAEILNLRHETNGDDDDGKPWVIAGHIFKIINDYLQPSNTLSATEAAQKIDALFPNNRPDVDGEEKEEAGSFLAEFWETVVMIAQQIPALHPAQDKLVGLLKALSELPTNLTVDIWGSDCRVWQDLPLIGVHMVEAENCECIPTLTV
jgi:hypothetical protein